MKKILITGNSGYIGSHLCKMLEKDYEVHGLDIREPQCQVDKFYQIDINKPMQIDEEYDAVIHDDVYGLAGMPVLIFYLHFMFSNLTFSKLLSSRVGGCM